MTTIHTIAELLAPSPLELLQDTAGDLEILSPATLTDAGPGQVSFCGSTATAPEQMLRSTRASLVIVDHGVPFEESAMAANGVAAFIRSPNARLDFMRVVQQCFAPPRPRGTHATASVAKTAHIAEDAYVGPLCTIGENVKIGSGTVIHAGVHIYHDVHIGQNVTINSGTVIGADGFGYERNAEGAFEKFPHVGGVVIEDNVEIGANTCIDRGTLGNTRVCEGARIDNLVHIAHNTVIGRHAAVIADAMIGGSTQIGDYAWIAPSACLRDRIAIGERAVVGLAAVVTKSVPDGVTVMGSPAREAGDQKRILKQLNRLADTD